MLGVCESFHWFNLSASLCLQATFDCLQKTYGFLTPEFWKETSFKKSPYQEYTDLLAEKGTPTTKAITEAEDQAS